MEQIDSKAWRVQTGKRLKLLRKSLPGFWSRPRVEESVQRLYGLSISKEQLEKIESGKSFPGYPTLEALRKLYRTDYNFILGGIESAPFDKIDYWGSPQLRIYFAEMLEAGVTQTEAMYLLGQAAKLIIASIHSKDGKK